MKITAWISHNGGHSPNPGQLLKSVTIQPQPVKPGDANPNAELLDKPTSQMNLTFQQPSDALIAALPLGKRCVVEITVLDD